MNILAVSLREENTLCALVKVKKNFVETRSLFTTGPALDALTVGDADALAGVFAGIKAQAGGGGDLYVSAPTFTFKLDCFLTGRLLDGPMLHIKICEAMGIESDQDEYYSDSVMEVPSGGPDIYLSAVCQRKEYADTLIEAAETSGLRICSFMPEAVAALYWIDKWDNPLTVIEIGKTSSAFISFAPDKGVFSMPVPMLGWSKILHPSGNGEFGNLCQRLVLNDLSAQRMWGAACHETPIYIVSEKGTEISRLLSKTQYAGRVKNIPDGNNQAIFKNSDSEIKPYAVPLGISLNPLFERRGNEKISVNKLAAERGFDAEEVLPAAEHPEADDDRFNRFNSYTGSL